MIGEAEYALLDQVAVAPVIFQEFVPAEVDLRITVVGEELFVARSTPRSSTTRSTSGSSSRPAPASG